MGMEERKKLMSKIMNSKQRGSTMVETLVSFVVLFLVLASLYGIVAFSSELYMRSVDTSRIRQKFYAEIYKKDDSLVTGTDTHIEKKQYKAGSYKQGSTDKYSALQLTLVEEDPNSALHDSRIRLSNISATTYEWKDDTLKDKILLPKTVEYSYEGKK